MTLSATHVDNTCPAATRWTGGAKGDGQLRRCLLRAFRLEVLCKSMILPSLEVIISLPNHEDLRYKCYTTRYAAYIESPKGSQSRYDYQIYLCNYDINVHYMNLWQPLSLITTWLALRWNPNYSKYFMFQTMLLQISLPQAYHFPNTCTASQALLLHFSTHISDRKTLKCKTLRVCFQSYFPRLCFGNHAQPCGVKHISFIVLLL